MKKKSIKKKENKRDRELEIYSWMMQHGRDRLTVTSPTTEWSQTALR